MSAEKYGSFHFDDIFTDERSYSSSVKLRRGSKNVKTLNRGQGEMKSDFSF